MSSGLLLRTVGKTALAGMKQFVPRSQVGMSFAARSLATSTVSEENKEEQQKQQSSGSSKGWRNFKRALIATAVTGAGVGGYLAYNHDQFFPPSDPAPAGWVKKKLVILGTGWAVVPLLKQINTNLYDVQVISPRNFFLFTPLLPSTTVGTVESRSIIDPIRRYCLRDGKSPDAQFVEAECTDIDPLNKVVTCEDKSAVKGQVNKFALPYDYLVVAVGAESNTFGIPGVKEHTSFMKELEDGVKVRNLIMDAFESASIPGQPESEQKRLLHFCVVGGGPTGVETAAEVRDFVRDNLGKWFPSLVPKVKITLIEALPHILSMFDKTLVEYTEQTFAQENIDILSRCAVTKIEEKQMTIKRPDGTLEDLPYGITIWATGNTARPLVRNLLSKLPPDQQKQRRGLMIDGYTRVLGAPGMFSLGDCSASALPPTAQVASQQGKYLATLLNEMPELVLAKKDEPQADVLASAEQFKYKHLGALAYIGDEKAIIEFPTFSASGRHALYIWRSAYLSSVFSLRNKAHVVWDWMSTSLFGRDISRA